MWSTINEPIATYVGYGLGGFAPGHINELWGNQARHNILVAHGKGVEGFRSFGFKDSKIHTDFESQEQMWKKSAYWYRDFILDTKKNNK